MKVIYLFLLTKYTDNLQFNRSFLEQLDLLEQTCGHFLYLWTNADAADWTQTAESLFVYHRGPCHYAGITGSWLEYAL